MSGKLIEALERRFDSFVYVLCSIPNIIKQVTQKHCSSASNHAPISVSFVYFVDGKLIKF
jgi:hypothetical protein